MVSDAQSNVEMIRRDLKNVPRAFRTRTRDALPSSRMNGTLLLYTQRATNLVDLFTVGNYPHILVETMDNLNDP